MIQPPADCQTLSSPLAQPPARRPYPPVGQPLPLALERTKITGSLSAERVRQALSRLIVVPRDQWEHSYSHVYGMDESGWLVLDRNCLTWRLRPGGLGWVTYPDGTGVYLAGRE